MKNREPSVEELGNELLKTIQAGGASVGSIAHASQEQGLEHAKAKLAIRSAKLISIQNAILICTNVFMIILTAAILFLTYRMYQLTIALTLKK